MIPLDNHSQCRVLANCIDWDLILSILEQRELISNGLPAFMLNKNIRQLKELRDILLKV